MPDVKMKIDLGQTVKLLEMLAAVSGALEVAIVALKTATSETEIAQIKAIAENALGKIDAQLSDAADKMSKPETDADVAA